MSTPSESSRPEDASEYRGMLCLEGEWGEDLTDHRTVQPLVAYVASISDCDYLHRRVQNTAGLLDLVDRWCQDEALTTYGILYIAAHGGAGSVCLGSYSDPETDVTLDQLEGVIDGRGAGGIIYLGACSVVRQEEDVRHFVSRTGLSAVAGYTADVDFVLSSAVDLIALNALSQYAAAGWARRHIEKQVPHLVERLGFRIIKA